MAFVPTYGAEPIAGYQLVERLGTGGYGTVWKATAPGGLTKAIKFVFGDLTGHQAEQELKALGRIKEVRHPFLLSLERFEVIDGQLFIVTELADKSMLDRFNECKETGLPGIPRDELLSYLRDASEALDYMNDTHGLQHLDIKPQNLLLVGGRVKVADFGLVKDMVGTSVTATGGVTPIYATPEAFDGRVSRYSDQYSLAVVYQEMLTGVRPYPGTTVMQLAAQHMSGRPLLDPLPASDRPAIGKALSKVPEKRFSTCRDMVESLIKGKESQSVPSPAKSEGPSKRVNSQTPLPARATIPSLSSQESLGQATEVGLEVAGGIKTLKSGSAPQISELPKSIAIPPSPTTDKAALRPTLFVGVGGLGCSTLRNVKHRLQQRFGNLATLPLFQFLCLDTDRAALRQSHQDGPGAPLGPDETLLTPLATPEHYRGKSKSILKWLDRRWMFGIPRSLVTERIRPLGYLAFVDHAKEVLDKLREVLASLTDPDTLTDIEEAGHELRTQSPRIFLIASISGATGGGMLIGLAYALQQVLGELKLANDGLCGILLHASSPKPAEKDIACVNTTATLAELKFFSDPANAYPGDPGNHLAAFGPQSAPFEDCYLVGLGDQVSRDEAEAATANVAEYLHLDAATPGGIFLDQYRAATKVEPRQNFAPLLRSFGQFRINLPRNELIHQATLLFCRNLVARWPGDQSFTEKEQVELEAENQTNGLGLHEETLVARFHTISEQLLGEELGTLFLKLIIPAPSDSPTTDAPARGAEPFDPGLKAIDGLLGSGRDEAGVIEAPATPFQNLLRAKATEVTAEIGGVLLDWLRNMIEDPGRRLKAAETGARWLSQYLLNVLEDVRKQAAQLRQYRENLRMRLISGGQVHQLSGIRWLSSVRRQRSESKSNTKAMEYCWARIGEIALENTHAVLGAIYHQLADFTKDLGLCRQKLNQFLSLFDPGSNGRKSEFAPQANRNSLELLPAPAKSASEAARNIVNNLSLDLVQQFEASIQDEVLDKDGGLWGMLAGNREPQPGRREDRAGVSLAFWDLVSKDMNLARSYKEKLLTRARPFILSALNRLDPATLFCESHQADSLLEDAVYRCVRLAQPKPGVGGGWKHLLLSLPDTAAAEKLNELITACQPDVATTRIKSEDDVIICLEAAHCPLEEMKAALVGLEPHYAALAERVFTRIDISWPSISLETP